MTRSEYEEYPFGDLGRGTTDGCLLQDHYGCYIRGAVIEESSDIKLFRITLEVQYFNPINQIWFKIIFI
jgi:hypothetical protein